MNWNAVCDSLPKINDSSSMFIVYTENGIGVASYDGKFTNVRLRGNVQYSDNNVTHWMPMPDKP